MMRTADHRHQQEGGRRGTWEGEDGEGNGLHPLITGAALSRAA